MKKYFFYGIILFVLAILPSLHILSALKIYNEKRLFEIALLLVTGFEFIAVDYSQCNPAVCDIPRPYGLNPYIKGVIALFFGLGLMSLIFNRGWYHGLQELSLYLLLLILLFYVARIYHLKSKKFDLGIVWLLLIFGGLYTLKFFIGYGMHLTMDYPLWPGWYGKTIFFGFAHPRFFNQIQVWTLPLFLIWITSNNSFQKLKNYSKTLTTCNFFLASFWWCLVIQSGGRGAILSLLIAPFIILICFKSNSHRYIKKYLYSFVIGLVLKFVLFDILSDQGVAASVTRSGVGASSRLIFWPKIIRAISEKPIVGYGPVSIAKVSSPIQYAHPHNSVLQIGYEFGLPALCIALGLILFGLYKWFKQGARASDTDKTKDTNIRIGVSTSLLAGLGYSLFSGVMVMPLSQLWMALIGGWVLGIYWKSNKTIQLNRNKDLSGFPNLTGLTIKAVILAAIVFMSCSLVIDVPKLRENQQHYIMKYGGKYHPRFWQQGKTGLEK